MLHYINPSSPNFSAILSEFFSKLSLYLFHLSSSHISRRLNNPAITTSLLKFAYFFKLSGINILPSESNSTSTAPERNKRAKERVSCLPMDNPPSISANGAQFLDGKMNKQPSRPLVKTAPSPSSFLNFDGIASRFLGSKLCLYSPISKELCNSRVNSYPQESLVINTSIHFLPLTN